MNPKVLLLSVHPEYSDKIFDGTKSVELRRTTPKINPGDLIVIYASSPRKSVVGIVTVEKVVEKQIHDLWLDVKDKAGISHECFLAYFSGSKTGCGIYLHKKFRYSQSCVSLERLKQSWENFHPPQSYRYLNQAEVNLFDTLLDVKIMQISNIHQNSFCLV